MSHVAELEYLEDQSTRWQVAAYFQTLDLDVHEGDSRVRDVLLVFCEA